MLRPVSLPNATRLCATLGCLLFFPSAGVWPGCCWSCCFLPRNRQVAAPTRPLPPSSLSRSFFSENMENMEAMVPFVRRPAREGTRQHGALAPVSSQWLSFAPFVSSPLPFSEVETGTLNTLSGKLGCNGTIASSLLVSSVFRRQNNQWLNGSRPRRAFSVCKCGGA